LSLIVTKVRRKVLLFVCASYSKNFMFVKCSFLSRDEAEP
jgi:hypothetical protein